jgi:polysaccharide biosynthesis transport protein
VHLYFVHHIANRFVEERRNVTAFLPESSRDSLTQIQGNETLKYNFEFIPSKDYHHITGLDELKKHAPNSDIIIAELPDLANHQMPVEIIKDSNFNLMVVNSKRTWSEADTHLLQLFRQSHTSTPHILLNKMSESELELVLGELPKKRSWARLWLKRILSLNFNIVRV